MSLSGKAAGYALLGAGVVFDQENFHWDEWVVFAKNRAKIDLRTPISFAPIGKRTSRRTPVQCGFAKRSWRPHTHRQLCPFDAKDFKIARSILHEAPLASSLAHEIKL
jgi:hypothetical protein